MSAGRVLVLRPEPGTSETANSLRSAGCQPVMAPLSEIRPLAIQSDIDADGVGCVAATSANALRHAPELLLARLRDKPLFAVGEATARAARLAGFGAVTAANDDGAALAAAISQDRPAGALLYLCGALRRPEFETMLAEQGVDVTALATYEAVPVDQSALFAALAAETGPLSALCHSPEAGRMLADLVGRHPGLTERLRVVAISARAGLPLASVGVAVDTAQTPTDRAMLAALRR